MHGLHQVRYAYAYTWGLKCPWRSLDGRTGGADEIWETHHQTSHLRPHPAPWRAIRVLPILSLLIDYVVFPPLLPPPPVSAIGDSNLLPTTASPSPHLSIHSSLPIHRHPLPYSTHITLLLTAAPTVPKLPLSCLTRFLIPHPRPSIHHPVRSTFLVLSFASVDASMSIKSHTFICKSFTFL